MKTESVWVTIKKFAEITGYSEKAVRLKQQRGIWKVYEHWIKAPDGRILINVSNVQIWIEEGYCNG